jgi:alkylated DNA nucleotide flippase Atl1
MALKPVKLSEKNKDFFALVHEVARLVPYGRVTSYGAIAKYLGSARSSRMVGWAMNAAHGDDSIPAHRVVKNAFRSPRSHAGIVGSRRNKHHSRSSATIRKIVLGSYEGASCLIQDFK